MAQISYPTYYFIWPTARHSAQSQYTAVASYSAWTVRFSALRTDWRSSAAETWRRPSRKASNTWGNCRLKTEPNDTSLNKQNWKQISDGEGRRAQEKLLSKLEHSLLKLGTPGSSTFYTTSYDTCQNRTHSRIKTDQLDVTCFIISLFTAQHVSNVGTSIFGSLRLIVDLFHVLYCSGSMCVVTVWFGWSGVVSVSHW